MAVFLPVVFVEEEAGQLFKDIAIAVTCAIVLSLFVSVLVIPMLARQFYGLADRRKGAAAPAGPASSGDDGPRSPATLSAAKRVLVPLTRLGARFADRVIALLSVAIETPVSRIVTVLGLTLASVLIVWAAFPKMEYLPQGNRNLLINILIPPPGLSYEERAGIGQYVFEETKPHFDKEIDGLPGIEDMFFVSAPTINLFGAISTREQRAGELIPLFNRVIRSIPGMYGISIQASIFEQGLGKGRVIQVDISGSDLEKIVAAAGTMYGMTQKEIPKAQIRPVPSLELLYPEVRFLPERDRVRAAGMSTTRAGHGHRRHPRRSQDRRLQGGGQEEDRPRAQGFAPGRDHARGSVQFAHRGATGLGRAGQFPVPDAADLFHERNPPFGAAADHLAPGHAAHEHALAGGHGDTFRTSSCPPYARWGCWTG